MISSSSISTAERDVSWESGLAAAGSFWFAHGMLPAVAFLSLVAILRTFDLDAQVADFFFDSSLGAFRGRDAWWANELLHTGGRDAVALLSLAALATAILGCVARFLPAISALRRWVRPASYFVLCVILSTGTVALLKQRSHRDCPWDMERWGGSRPYFRVLDARPASLPASGCFPGGHSSGGYSLLAFYFLGLQRDKKWARLGLCLGLGMGFALAFGQWARGAHFPSHDLWSAAICWYVALGIYAGFYRRRVWSLE